MRIRLRYLWIILFSCSCLFVQAQDMLKLYDKNGNYFMSLPISIKGNSNELNIRIGDDNPLQNSDNENVILWVFYSKVLWGELEKKDERIWTTTLKEFTPMDAVGMSLQEKSGRRYEKFLNKLELSFKVEDVKKSSVTLYLYAGKMQKNKKKDIMLYAALLPVELNPKLDQRGKLVIDAGEYTTPEKRDSLLYESAKKNIALCVDTATWLLNQAKGVASPDEIKIWKERLENLQIDFDAEEQSLNALGRGRDLDLVESIKQFKKICQEFTKVEQEAAGKAAAEAAKKQTGPENPEEKKMNPAVLIAAGLGGLMVLMSLFMVVFFKVLKRMQAKKEAEAKALAEKQLKKQLAEQKRMMRNANEGNPDRKKIKI